jgi:uncharacterized protein (AIM24 family)
VSIFKLNTEGNFHHLEINLECNQQAYVNADFIQYIKGAVHFVKPLSKKQTILKYYQYGPSALTSKIQGPGLVEIRPALGQYCIMDLSKKHNQQLVCNKNVFVASDTYVALLPQFNLSFQRLISSLPIKTYRLVGRGEAVLYSSGPLQQIELKNEKFSIYRGDLIAYSSSLTISQSVADDGLWGLSKSSKTIINLAGTGTIYCTKHQNLFHMLANSTFKNPIN